MLPEELLGRILYRDGLMLVIDKPAGIAVHKGMGSGANLQDMFDVLRFGLPNPPALAHRLDRDTSGCLVLGRHAKALRQLGLLFSNGSIGKTYLAVVEGSCSDTTGIIDLPLAKQSEKKHLWRMKVDKENGQPAMTAYRQLATNGIHSLIELTPHTGRTHQLRVHCAAMDCPIVGDKIYGTGDNTTPLLLHAQHIEIPLYEKKPAIAVTSPLPPHFAEAVEKIDSMVAASYRPLSASGE